MYWNKGLALLTDSRLGSSPGGFFMRSLDARDSLPPVDGRFLEPVLRCSTLAEEQRAKVSGLGQKGQTISATEQRSTAAQGTACGEGRPVADAGDLAATA